MDMKKELEATIGQPPASAIDIDSTITRMRRRMWRVRGTAAVATTGLVAAAAMLGWPMLAQTQPPTAAPIPSNVLQLPPAEAAPETEQQIAARLTVAVQGKLAALVPGATLVPNWAGHDAAVVYPERPYAVPTTLPWNQMRAQADLRDPAGTGFVDVLIGRTVAAPDATSYCHPEGAGMQRPGGQPIPSLPNDPCALQAYVGYPLGLYANCAEYDEVLDGDDECTEHTTAAGDYVIELRDDHEYRVDVKRADGTAVIVMSGAKGHAGGTRPTPALAVEQMVALATDPALAL